MPFNNSGRKKGRSAAQKQQTSRITTLQTSRALNDQNTAPNTSISTRGRKKSQTSILNSLIEVKNAQIRDLEDQLAGMTRKLTQLEIVLKGKDNTIKNLQEHSELNAMDLASFEADSHILGQELANSREHGKKLTKRVQRLVRDKSLLRSTGSAELSALQDHLSQVKSKSDLSHSQSVTKIAELVSTLEQTQSRLRQQSQLAQGLRKKSDAFRKQSIRARDSLKQTRSALKKISIWRPTKSGVYTPIARWLVRRLCQAGCSEEKVGSAIVACGEAFGIEIERVMDARTVSRAKREGGIFGIMQLGREITHAPAFGESQDGTGHRKTQLDSTHNAMLVPGYEPDIDDSDMSTWTYANRFVQVAPAVDHTAQTQLENCKKIGVMISQAYTNSPLARRDGKTMDPDDYIRKQTFQNMDHASDGKLKHHMCGDWKSDVAFKDLGEKEIEDMLPGEILKAMCEITDEEIEEAGGGSSATPDEKRTIAIGLLQHKIGVNVFEQLSETQQRLINLFVFGGCCGHKDLNAFRYGVVEMAAAWTKTDRPEPVILANKANDAIIQLSDSSDSAAVQRAINSSSRGGVKLVSLSGALFRHKDEGTGYQDRHRDFMAQRKLELHNEIFTVKFPDSSNTRYQSHSYGAAELITYHHLYLELMDEVRDSKVQPGFNHLESNVYKGLLDASTMTELAAIALYGNSVSWPYLREVRGSPGVIINLLDLTDLHRKLPDFCTHIANNPGLLLNPDTPQDQLTIDGQPWIDPMIIYAIRMLEPELPDLHLMISAMFSGSSKGWIRFTSEFVVGGPFDSLTPEERALIFIPSTNDANEGGLGSYRVHVRFRPSSTPTSFSSQARCQRNNTEKFITKLCDEEDHLYVMREARRQDASGESARYRCAVLNHQRQRAETTRNKQEKARVERDEEIVRLTEIGLVTDRAAIDSLTVCALKDQLSFYRKILQDTVLIGTLQKHLPLKAHKVSAVHAALTRHEGTLHRPVQGIEIDADTINHTNQLPATNDTRTLINDSTLEMDDSPDSDAEDGMEYGEDD